MISFIKIIPSAEKNPFKKPPLWEMRFYFAPVYKTNLIIEWLPFQNPWRSQQRRRWNRWNSCCWHWLSLDLPVIKSNVDVAVSNGFLAWDQILKHLPVLARSNSFPVLRSLLRGPPEQKRGIHFVFLSWWSKIPSIKSNPRPLSVKLPYTINTYSDRISGIPSFAFLIHQQTSRFRAILNKLYCIQNTQVQKTKTNMLTSPPSGSRGVSWREADNPHSVTTIIATILIIPDSIDYKSRNVIVDIK